MPSWRAANAFLYRLYSLVQEWPRKLGLEFPAADADGRPGRKRLVFLAWGLIGDCVLTTSVLRHFKKAFPELEIVCLGREQARWVLAPHVDVFVPIDPTSAGLGLPFIAALRGGQLARCDVLTGDIHVFYGGLARLRDLIVKLPARLKIFYEGYADRRQLAPGRRFPKGVVVVPSLGKPEVRPGSNQGVVDEWHVLHDVLHFFKATFAQVYGRAMPPRATEGRLAPVVPVPQPGPILERLGLERGTYVCCHVVSNNPKKDWPISNWEQLLESSPRRFVILGSPKDRARVAKLAGDRVRILCGETSLPETIAVIESAAAFVGLDSGLAHLATNLGQKSIVIAQNATLGWFFPYPRLLARNNLTTLWNTRSPECVGCFFRCPRESLWELAMIGARCMRELQPETVLEALERALAP